MAHLIIISSPVVIPPSIPPKLLVFLFIPSFSSYVISSITFEPGNEATSNPKPISTPFMA